MSRRIALLAVTAVLTGCAASPERLRVSALGAPDWELCYVSLVGRADYRAAANQVIGERQLDCSRHMAMVNARLNADQAAAARSQAATANALQLLNAAQPRPPAPTNLPVNCNSYWRGTYWQTVCE